MVVSKREKMSPYDKRKTNNVLSLLVTFLSGKWKCHQFIIKLSLLFSGLDTFFFGTNDSGRKKYL